MGVGSHLLKLSNIPLIGGKRKSEHIISVFNKSDLSSTVQLNFNSKSLPDCDHS